MIGNILAVIVWAALILPVVLILLHERRRGRQQDAAFALVCARLGERIEETRARVHAIRNSAGRPS